LLGKKPRCSSALTGKWPEVENIREPKIHDREGGIECVVRLMKQPRLFVFDDCRNILDELGRYAHELVGHVSWIMAFFDLNLNSKPGK